MILEIIRCEVDTPLPFYYFGGISVSKSLESESRDVSYYIVMISVDRLIIIILRHNIGDLIFMGRTV